MIRQFLVLCAFGAAFLYFRLAALDLDLAHVDHLDYAGLTALAAGLLIERLP